MLVWDNSEMGSNLYDWINILATFILDIIKCHGLQTNDSEMNQRINHLVFILNLVKEGNNKQLCTVLQDLKTLLVGRDLIENAQIKQVSFFQDDVEGGSISWTSEQYLKSWQDRVQRRYNQNKIIVLSNQEQKVADYEDGPLEEHLEDNLNTELSENLSEEFSLTKLKEEQEGAIAVINSDLKPVRIKILKKLSQQNEKQISKKGTHTIKQCHICNFKHKQERKIEEHLYEDHDQKNCRDCGQSFDNFNRYYKHRVQSHGEPIQCSECPMVLKSYLSYMYHRDKVHRATTTATKRWKKCDHCEFTARYDTGMNRHLFEKHEQTICSECGQNFTDFSAYERHRRSHNPLKCQYCPAVFTNLSGLRKHENNHEKNREKNPEADQKKKEEMCPKCGKYVVEMKRHLLWFHAAPEPCPWCGAVVKNVKRHLRRLQCDVPEDQRTRIKEKSPCHICSKMIETKLLKNHIRIVHGTKNFECSQCSYKTYTKNNLSLHTKRVHERKPLKEVCPQCSKECVNLEWHIETYHTRVY